MNKHLVPWKYCFENFYQRRFWNYFYQYSGKLRCTGIFPNDSLWSYPPLFNGVKNYLLKPTISKINVDHIAIFHLMVLIYRWSASYDTDYFKIYVGLQLRRPKQTLTHSWRKRGSEYWRWFRSFFAFSSRITSQLSLFLLRFCVKLEEEWRKNKKSVFCSNKSTAMKQWKNCAGMKLSGPDKTFDASFRIDVQSNVRRAEESFYFENHFCKID